jgi:hypothetical protein
MAALADGIDFIADLVSDMTSGKRVKSQGVDYGGYKNGSALILSVCAFMWFVVWNKFTQKDFSAIVTAGATVQVVGFLILSIRIRTMKSVAGLSSKTLQMFVLYLCARLPATCLFRGYIPIDRSGHWFYQLMDFCTLLLACHLLHSVHKTNRHSYQDEHDTLPIWPFVVASVVLAIFVHGNLNRNFFFDTIWFVSLYLETCCMLPQLWMMSKLGCQVNCMSSQFVVATVAAKVMVLTFWIWAYNEVDAVDPSHKIGTVIVSSYMVQLMLSADFMFYYVKGLLQGNDEVVLPQANEVEM